MKKILRDFLAAVLAGAAIGIGGAVFLSSSGSELGKYVGALFFCIGLLTVIYFKLHLFTGKVGYASRLSDIPRMLLCILGNAVGAVFVGGLPYASAAPIVAAKLQLPFYIVFLKAVFCGVLIYIAVEVFKKKGTMLGVIFGIPAFILAGFEHSIADMYYIFAAREFSLEALGFIGIVLAGNAVGSLLFAKLSDIVLKDE